MYTYILWFNLLSTLCTHSFNNHNNHHSVGEVDESTSALKEESESIACGKSMGFAEVFFVPLLLSSLVIKPCVTE